MNAARDLARQLVSPGEVLLRRQAVVTGTDITGRLATVNLAGSSQDVAGIPCLDGYSPKAGDTVWLLGSGASIMVLGTLAHKTDAGYFSGTSDASGYVTIGHALGVVPRLVQVTLHSPDGHTTFPISAVVDAMTTTSIHVRTYTLTAAWTSALVECWWEARS